VQKNSNKKFYQKKLFWYIVTTIIAIIGIVLTLLVNPTTDVEQKIEITLTNSTVEKLIVDQSNENNEKSKKFEETQKLEPEQILESEPEHPEVKLPDQTIEKVQLPDLFWEDNSFRIVGFDDLKVPSSSPIEIRQTIEYAKGNYEVSQICVKVEIRGPTGGKIPFKFKDLERSYVPPHMKELVPDNSNVPSSKCFDNVESLNRLEYEVTLIERGLHSVTHTIDYENKVDEIKETNNASIKKIDVI